MWLHLSKLANTVTVDQVVSMVKSQLDTTDVIAFSLLKAETTISSVSSLTFKDRIIAALRDKALTAGSWPVGLGVREFISLPQRPSHHRPEFTNTNTPIPVRHSPMHPVQLSPDMNCTLISPAPPKTTTATPNTVKMHQTTIQHFFLK